MTAATFDDIATKRDIKELELQIELVKKDIEIVKADLQRDIESVRTTVESVRADIEKSRTDLIKWFVGTAFAIASIGFMLVRFFEHGVL